MRILAVIILSISLVSCSTTKNQETSKHIDFKSVSKNTNSGFEKLTEQVIQNKVDFEKAWAIAWSHFSDPTPIPEVNFENETVVLVALGMRNNGGFQLNINTVHELGNVLTINYTETTPNPKCSNTQAIVFPYEFISIPKTSKKVTFNSSQQMGSCN